MNISLKDNPTYNWWVVLFILIAVYLIINLAVPYFGDNVLEFYIVSPIIWGLTGWMVLTFPRQRSQAKPRSRRAIIQFALIIAFFQLAMLFIFGLFTGFGLTHSELSTIVVARTLFYIVVTLVGMEICRAWLVRRLGRNHVFFALTLGTILFTIFDVSMSSMFTSREPMELIEYLNSSLFPSLAEHLLASYLALLAGPLAAILYRVWLQLFWWLCPILPDLTWSVEGIIGTFIPIIGMIVVNRYFTSQTLRSRNRRAEETAPTGWISVMVVSVAIIWFSVGVFPVHPVTIVSGSMSPAMQIGDIVVIVESSTNRIMPGDVIEYRTSSINVVHRVIEVRETENGNVFITKGDANDKPDEDPVLAANVVGKAVSTLPKVGWVAIMVKTFFTG